MPRAVGSIWTLLHETARLSRQRRMIIFGFPLLGVLEC